MSKTITQLTESTTILPEDMLHVVDIASDQDKKIKAANLWSGKPYGELYVTNNTTLPTVITTLGVAVSITNSTLITQAGLLKNFTHDSATGLLTYTGDEDITVMINIQCSNHLVSGVATRYLMLDLMYNDVVEVKGRGYGSAYLTTARRGISITCIKTISNGDTFSLNITNTTGTENIYVNDLNMNIVTL